MNSWTRHWPTANSPHIEKIQHERINTNAKRQVFDSATRWENLLWTTGWITVCAALIKHADADRCQEILRFRKCQRLRPLRNANRTQPLARFELTAIYFSLERIFPILSLALPPPDHWSLFTLPSICPIPRRAYHDPSTPDVRSERARGLPLLFATPSPWRAAPPSWPCRWVWEAGVRPVFENISAHFFLASLCQRPCLGDCFSAPSYTRESLRPPRARVGGPSMRECAF